MRTMKPCESMGNSDYCLSHRRDMAVCNQIRDTLEAIEERQDRAEFQAERDWVFVYGTLRPGESAERILGTKHDRFPALAEGQLCRTEAGYYGAVYCEPGRGVPGYAVQIDAHRLAELDQYEGSGYDRIRVKVRGLDGREQECWSYEWTGAWGWAEEL